MDDETIAKMWDANANVWTDLSRRGFDVYRDQINTPSFLSLLPPIEGLSGLDIGCGEGHNTRELAKRGANMCALDICETFLDHAVEEERKNPLGIQYVYGNACKMPYEDDRFAFVTAFMSLMDMSDFRKVFSEVYRVLQPNGFFQFSICHPCFQTLTRKHLRDEEGNTEGFVCTDYFDQKPKILEWMFSSVTESGTESEAEADYPPFRMPIEHHPLSDWINGLLAAGFSLTLLHEPYASEEVLKNYPKLEDTRSVAYFLIIQVCKKIAR